MGIAVAVLVFYPEPDYLQIDNGPTVWHILQYFIVLNEVTTTSCTNFVYTHYSNMPSNHNVLDEAMLEQLEPT